MPAPSIRSPRHKENEDKAVRISEVWQGKIKIFYEFSWSSVEHGALVFHFLKEKNSVCIIWRKSLGMQLTSRCGGLPCFHPWVMLRVWLLHTLLFRGVRKGAKPSSSRIVSAPDTVACIWNVFIFQINQNVFESHLFQTGDNWCMWTGAAWRGQPSWQSLSPCLSLETSLISDWSKLTGTSSPLKRKWAAPWFDHFILENCSGLWHICSMRKNESPFMEEKALFDTVWRMCLA